MSGARSQDGVEPAAAQQVDHVVLETPGAQPVSQPAPQVQPVSVPAGQAVAMSAANLAAPQPQVNPVAPPVEIGEDDPKFKEFVSKRVPAGICGILLGGLGIHKFILGQSTAGLIMLLVSLVGGLFTGFTTSLAMSSIGLVEGII